MSRALVGDTWFHWDVSFTSSLISAGTVKSAYDANDIDQ